MTNLQFSLLGGTPKMDIDMTKEVKTIMETYPHISQSFPEIAWLYFKRNCGFMAQLDDKNKGEFLAALEHIDGLRRRHQEFKEIQRGHERKLELPMDLP